VSKCKKEILAMLDITTLPEKDQTYLNRLRRYARARGFRILRDWTGTYSLVDARIAPQRALDGLVHVPLAAIGVALTTPLPPLKPKRVKRATVVEPMARLVEAMNSKAANANGNGGWAVSRNALVSEAVNTLRARGFVPVVKNGGKHVKIGWIDHGRRFLLVVSRSPSNFRAERNSRALLKRLLNGGEHV
jgi:hypothetical protein